MYAMDNHFQVDIDFAKVFYHSMELMPVHINGLKHG